MQRSLRFPHPLNLPLQLHAALVLDPAADFLAEKVRCGEPIYGVTTGFGSSGQLILLQNFKAQFIP